MEISEKTERKASPTGAAVDIAIRLGVLAVLVAWCFQILRPFISPVISKKILCIYDKWIVKFTGQRLPIFEAMVQLNTQLAATRFIPSGLFACLG